MDAMAPSELHYMPPTMATVRAAMIILKILFNFYFLRSLPALVLYCIINYVVACLRFLINSCTWNKKINK
jgi:hypothetical protein